MPFEEIKYPEFRICQGKGRFKGLKNDGVETRPLDGRLDHEDGLFDRLFQARGKACIRFALFF